MTHGARLMVRARMTLGVRTRFLDTAE